jgi:hypothetical protein
LTAAAAGRPIPEYDRREGLHQELAVAAAEAELVVAQVPLREGAHFTYRGLIKKRLMPVRIDGPTPLPGTVVTMDGREVGEIRSSRDGLGLALLRIEPEGKRLAAGEASLVPIRPAWMRLENDFSP